ncbi:MAG TPA: hypothetical protein VKR31_13615 [Rhizomicrobium sp.]|nr:hypothetical protein [Rhizomicrobium sp.]
MADVNGFVSELMRQKGLSEQARSDLLTEVNSRLDDMVLDQLDSEAALDEYNSLCDAGDQTQLRAFLQAAIPDLDVLEKQVLDDFRKSYRA